MAAPCRLPNRPSLHQAHPRGKTAATAGPCSAAPAGGIGRAHYRQPIGAAYGVSRGLDLAGVSGTGPNGRIVKPTLKPRLPAAHPPHLLRPPQRLPLHQLPHDRRHATIESEFELEALSTMRKTIARRLTESKQQVPHFYLTVDCEIDELLALRKTLNEKGDGVLQAFSVNDLVIKAAATLRRVPKANVVDR